MAADHPISSNVHRRHRAIWLSDIHLGTRGCKADFLLDFLRCNESDYLYLVGDIIDGWQLRRSWYWDQKHNDVVQKILRKVRKGTKVIYVPGNHDEFARDYVDNMFGGISLKNDSINELNDGRRLILMHGDEFYFVVIYAWWLSLLGDVSYQFALSLNHCVKNLRRRMGYPYWSLSAYLKHKVKYAVKFIEDFEAVVARAGAQRGGVGLVCGQIHNAELKEINGIVYCNDGDWFVSCTALVETMDGRLEILHWSDAGCSVLSAESGATPIAA